MGKPRIVRNRARAAQTKSPTVGTGGPNPGEPQASSRAGERLPRPSYGEECRLGVPVNPNPQKAPILAVETGWESFEGGGI